MKVEGAVKVVAAPMVAVVIIVFIIAAIPGMMVIAVIVGAVVAVLAARHLVVAVVAVISERNNYELMGRPDKAVGKATSQRYILCSMIAVFYDRAEIASTIRRNRYETIHAGSSYQDPAWIIQEK